MLFWFPSRIKNLPNDPVFSNLVVLSKRVIDKTFQNFTHFLVFLFPNLFQFLCFDFVLWFNRRFFHYISLNLTGKKSSKMKRTRNSLRGKFENQTSSTGGKTIKPRPVTTMDFPEDLDLNSEDFRNQMLGIPSPVPEDDHGFRTPAKGTLKQSRSHPNLRDMINRISTSINPGSSSNLSTSFRSKNKKSTKCDHVNGAREWK